MRFDYCTKNVQNYLLQRRRRPVDSDATLDVFKGNTFYTISLKIDPCGACLRRAPECFDVDPTQEKRMRTMRTPPRIRTALASGLLGSDDARQA